MLLADFEDAQHADLAQRHRRPGRTCVDAIEGTIEFTAPEGKRLPARATTARDARCVRPRGWHLAETHLLVDGEPVVGALVDFGLLLLPQRRASCSTRGSRPVLLPAEDGEPPRGAAVERRLRVRPGRARASPRGTIRATVLIETIPAAFEMDEILYELREHAAGLNAGRWDYMFSMIKYFRDAARTSCCPTATR